MNYLAHVPLAGGFTLGNMNVLGKPPVAITSYSPFEANDTLLKRYLDKKDLNVPYHLLDKEKPDLSKIYGKIDFATAVPPCSGLSQAAQRKPGTRGTAAPNDWMYESANFLLGEVQPTVYAFENAPTLYTNAGTEVRENLIEIGKKYGYSITFYKTNTLLHGVPQFRPRTFGIFYKGPNAPILNFYNRQSLHISDFLKQIPKNASHQDEYITSEWDITKFEITKYLIHKYGKNWRDALLSYRTHLTTYDYLRRTNLLDEFQEFQKTLPDATETVAKNIEYIKKKVAMGMNFRIGYRVLELDKDYVYAVIGEMMGKQVHPTEDRIMNMREFMHLMGLPHDYELNGPKEYPKISQNVPVKTCEDITIEIIEIIKGNRLFAGSSVYMQDNTKPTEFKNTAKSLF